MNPAIALLIAVVVVAAVLIVSSANARQREQEQKAAQEAEAERKRAAGVRRRNEIISKYGNTDVAEKIINGTVWIGETAEQLRDSLGLPADIDQKALKTKRKEIWKYAHRGGNRYGLRFTLENGVVVGWDERL